MCQTVKIHMTPHRVREIEGECQSRDFFWTDGYDFDTEKKKPRKSVSGTIKGHKSKECLENAST